VCLENRKQMPADEIEVTEGAEEGLVLHNSRGPREILGENGKCCGLRTVECTAVFDANGRFNPTFNEGKTSKTIEADTVIFSIGQSSDLSFLEPGDGVESNRGLIKVDPETYQTTAPDVFACGDIAHGPRLFINAIRSAQIAARSMHDFLRGTRTQDHGALFVVAGLTPCARAGTSFAANIRRLRMPAKRAVFTAG
jgi:formate dehydrogenase beta subunit